MLTTSNTHSTTSLQCDQKVRLFFDIWPFVTMKISQKCHKLAKVGSAFCQMRKKLTKIYPILINFCQKGETLPNLVTLSPWPLSSQTFFAFRQSVPQRWLAGP